jgi:hypothetical protein
MNAATLATWLLLGSAPAGLEVTGEASCPAPAEVSRRLGELLPVTGDALQNHAPSMPGDATAAARVVLTRSQAGLRLVLLGPNANELATRELAAQGSCDDLAAAAAVVIAAWRADLDPDLTPTVALPSRPEPPVPVPPSIVRQPPPPLPARSRSFELGLGIMGSETGGDVAPGAVLTGALELGEGRFGLDAGLSATTARSASVGPFANAASWTRATLALGPSAELRRDNLRLDLRAQALAALLHVRGVGLPTPGSDTVAELGVSAGAKLELVTGTSAVWLAFDVRDWPGNQRLIITNGPEPAQLPRVELVASLGLGLGRFP